MVAIVVSIGQVTVGGVVYNSLKYKASIDGSGLITIHSDPVGEDVLLYGAAAGDVSLNGTTYGSVTAFVAAFNTAIQNANLGVNVGRNTSYPDTPFSAHITANTIAWVANYVKPGWVTIKALSTNGGNVYVGPTGLTAGSGELEPGESVTYEVADLSTVWALNITVGYIINVFGAYKN
jgi:hypothetical protein